MTGGFVVSGKNADKMVTLQEAEEQVIMTAKRLALLYHFTAEVLAEKLGIEKGKEMLEEIIRRYGCDSGIAAKARVKELGLPLTADNFKMGSDLPRWGWKTDTVLCEDGVRRDRVTYCPLAEVWKGKGSEELGRIYCFVDQAKYHAYNEAGCVHLKNILDGDDCCLFDILDKAESGE